MVIRLAFFVFLPVLELTADSLTIEVEPQFFELAILIFLLHPYENQLGVKDGSKFR